MLVIRICLITQVLFWCLPGFGQLRDSSAGRANSFYLVMGVGSMSTLGNAPMLSFSTGLDFEHYNHCLGARVLYGSELNIFGGDHNEFEAYRLHYGYSIKKGNFAITPLLGMLYLRKRFYKLVQGGFFSNDEVKYDKIPTGNSPGIAGGISCRLINKRVGIATSINGAYAGKHSFFNWDFSVVLRIGK